jgi:hypothetical protein
MPQMSLDTLKLAIDFISQLMTIAGALLAFSASFAFYFLPKPLSTKWPGTIVLYGAWAGYIIAIVIGFLTRWRVISLLGDGSSAEAVLSDTWFRIGSFYVTPIVFSFSIALTFVTSFFFLYNPKENRLWKAGL